MGQALIKNSIRDGFHGISSIEHNMKIRKSFSHVPVEVVKKLLDRLIIYRQLALVLRRSRRFAYG